MAIHNFKHTLLQEYENRNNSYNINTYVIQTIKTAKAIAPG